MLRNALRAIGSLLLPSGCIVCGEHVAASMHRICPRCRYDIPLTNYWLEQDNPVKELFAGKVPIVEGSSFFFFSGHSLWRTLIHRFKYGGHWQIAYELGRWYGSELKASGLYDDVDVVLPIPLHPLKLLSRGYNQSTYLAEGIARSMGISVDSHTLRRHRNNPSQARRKASDRWLNVEDLFTVRNPQRIKSKHILVVDDVLTSGATLSSAISTILNATPDCRISVATLAVTHHITPSR